MRCCGSSCRGWCLMSGDYVVKLQPADRVDHISGDGTELTQRPFPFFVTASGLEVR